MASSSATLFLTVGKVSFVGSAADKPAVRQTKMQAIKAELDQLATSGRGVENVRARYMELMAQQEQLRRQADAEIAMR